VAGKEQEAARDAKAPATRTVRVRTEVAAVGKSFDYLVPPGWDHDVRVGTRVRVPLHGRSVRGWVVDADVSASEGVELLALKSWLGWGPPEGVVALADWAAWRWAGPASFFLHAASPETVVRTLPRAPVAGALPVAGAGGVAFGLDPAGPATMVRRPPSADPIDLVLEEVGDHLTSLRSGSVAGVVLAGCVDRLDLAEKVVLLREAVRVTASGGSVVVLASDQEAWDRALAPPARDLLPGRPFHPETWMLLLERAGARAVEWHRPERGSVHAVVAEVER